jgi:hypothetical protein
MTMRARLQAVVETKAFADDAKRLLSDFERQSLIDWLAANPLAGDLMAGTGGARKVRWAAKGKGKSGGVRTITYFAGEGVPLFLLAVFAKGEKVNLSKAERNALKAALTDLADEYRKGVRRHVESRRKNPAGRA